MSNHMSDKVWYEITYPFLSFNSSAVEIWEWISKYSLHIKIDISTSSILKLIHISKLGPVRL